MAKITKAQSGIKTKTRTVEKSPTGLHKLITKEKVTPSSKTKSVKEVRTFKGLLKGAPKSTGILNKKEEEIPLKTSLNARNGKQMLKRADGSVSQRGLWDNIRAAAKRNKAAGKPGKKPTAAMLKQERKIKAKSK